MGGVGGKSEVKRFERKEWRSKELGFLVLYAAAFYMFVIRRSIQLSFDHRDKLYGLRPGFLSAHRLNDVSDAQWRNFLSNLPILTLVFGIFATVGNFMRSFFQLKAKGMSFVWLFFSLSYLSYLHGACIIFILLIASLNFALVKISARTKFFPLVIWGFNLFFLIGNRVYEGYPFSMFGQHWAYLDSFRGNFRWHICFNFVILRMISFGYDYHWAHRNAHFNLEKHAQGCYICRSGKQCYHHLQEKSVPADNFVFTTYLCYLVYFPLYIAGPIISFNAFSSQLDMPQKMYSARNVAWYGFRWIFSLFLMVLMTHWLYYNALANSGLWKSVSATDIFVIGYGVLNFMWLKFFLIWRYFRFWSLICGIATPENMPRCINNCYSLESFWKDWHASFNKWLVRYIYIPLGGSHRKLLNVWVVFTFVAVWHDLEWKLLSWAWLTCIFFIPELVVKSAAESFQAESAVGVLVFQELRAVAGAITITCLMVANLVGYVIGPSGIEWMTSRFLGREGLPVLSGMLVTFYVGTKIMIHIEDAKQCRHQN